MNYNIDKKIPDSSMYVGWNLPQCFSCKHLYTEGSIDKDNIQNKCDITKKTVKQDIFFGHVLCPFIEQTPETPDNV